MRMLLGLACLAGASSQATTSESGGPSMPDDSVFMMKCMGGYDKSKYDACEIQRAAKFGTRRLLEEGIFVNMLNAAATTKKEGSGMPGMPDDSKWMATCMGGAYDKSKYDACELQRQGKFGTGVSTAPVIADG